MIYLVNFLKKYWKHLIGAYFLFNVFFIVVNEIRDPDMPSELLCKPNPTSMYTDRFEFGVLGLLISRTDNNPNTDNETFFYSKKDNNYYLRSTTEDRKFIIKKNRQVVYLKSDYGLYYDNDFKYMLCWSALPSEL